MGRRGVHESKRGGVAMQIVSRSVLRSTVVGLSVIITFGWLVPAGGHITRTLTYSPSELVVTDENGYQTISLPGCSWMTKVGCPALPFVMEEVPVGRGEWARAVSITHVEYEELPGEYLICPAQAHMSEEGTYWVDPNPEVYESSAPYPGQWVHLAGQREGGGSPLASLYVFPVQYVPAERKVRVCRSITFTVYTEPIDKIYRYNRTRRSPWLSWLLKKWWHS